MPGVAGKKTRVRLATTVNGTYNLVAGIKSASYTIDGAPLDDSEFGVDWIQRIQGLKDFKVTLSGTYRPDDTNGQVVARAALLNDTALFARVLPDGGTTANAGFQCEVKVTKFAVDPSVDGIVGVSIELEGTGAATLV